MLMEDTTNPCVVLHARNRGNTELFSQTPYSLPLTFISGQSKGSEPPLRPRIPIIWLSYLYGHCMLRFVPLYVQGEWNHIDNLLRARFIRQPYIGNPGPIPNDVRSWSLGNFSLAKSNVYLFVCSFDVRPSVLFFPPSWVQNKWSC